jgi:hypothetical protein
MTMKSILFSLTFLAVVPFGVVHAVSENTCDNMIKSGNFSDKDIQDCVKKFGESDSYKQNMAAKNAKEAADNAAKAKGASVKGNIETKKFTENELKIFGKPIFSDRLKWKNKAVADEKKITEGDSLCKYLGYDKAMSSERQEILADDAVGKGFTIGKALFGGVNKEPELYTEKDEKYTVRKFTEIICARVISKSVDGTMEELKKITEQIQNYSYGETPRAPAEEDKEEKSKSDKVNDKARDRTKDRFEGGSTPYGPQVPDYIKNDGGAKAE